MDSVAQDYVRLVLAVGGHDSDYVDAYYGPPEWRQQVEAEDVDLATLGERAAELTARLEAVEVPADASVAVRLRAKYLRRQLAAVAARIAMLGGERMSFDEESQALYDAVAPTHTEEHFQALQEALSQRLPGKGSLGERLTAYRQDFVIPSGRLAEVFDTAIAACRQRTVENLELPPEESFRVEYVTDKPWSAYNWYQGGFNSLIQVNTDLPIYIDRAIDLACHEGYPGHHVYNLLLEKHLVRDLGWVELSVYPLFSPQSLIAEGSANYGIEVAFPGAERVAYEAAELFPRAGLDPARAEEYYEVLALVDQLGYAGNEAARRYLDGDIDAAAAADWLTRFALMSPDRAEQRVRFFDRYRSYVINYNLGQDLVRGYIERRGGTEEAPEVRWREFGALLSSPRLPSDLS